MTLERLLPVCECSEEREKVKHKEEELKGFEAERLDPGRTDQPFEETQKSWILR